MKPQPPSELEFLSALGVFDQKLRRGWIGPGDDAAVIPPPEGGLAFAADLLVEDVHFRVSTSPPEDVGWKALAVNVSDMAAMGARPLACVVTLTVPESADPDWFTRLYAGFAQAEREFGCPIVGGDLSRGPNISISVAITGECGRRGPALRSGAKPGHLLFVTGAPGQSLAGLTLLERGINPSSESEKTCIASHLRPSPRLAFGREAARRGLASAMIDVSDGIARDCQNLSIQSKVKVVVETELLPVSQALREVADAHDFDPRTTAMTGGEDYELLFTAHPKDEEAIFDLAAATGLTVTRIGSAETGEGSVMLGADSEPLGAAPLGFDHFSKR